MPGGTEELFLTSSAAEVVRLVSTKNHILGSPAFNLFSANGIFHFLLRVRWLEVLLDRVNVGLVCHLGKKYKFRARAGLTQAARWSGSRPGG